MDRTAAAGIFRSQRYNRACATAGGASGAEDCEAVSAARGAPHHLQGGRMLPPLPSSLSDVVNTRFLLWCSTVKMICSDVSFDNELVNKETKLTSEHREGCDRSCTMINLVLLPVW